MSKRPSVNHAANKQRHAAATWSPARLCLGGSVVHAYVLFGSTVITTEMCQHASGGGSSG